MLAELSHFGAFMGQFQSRTVGYETTVVLLLLRAALEHCREHAAHLRGLEHPVLYTSRPAWTDRRVPCQEPAGSLTIGVSRTDGELNG
jgi:hypothetical protein